MDHDGAAYYIAECERCLSMVPVPSNLCGYCGAPTDDHRFFLADDPLCPRPR
jgi:rRNA maturation endonuclease Nob1